MISCVEVTSGNAICVASLEALAPGAQVMLDALGTGVVCETEAFS